MAEKHGNLVAGAWVGARSGATFADEDPAHRDLVLGLFAASGPEDVASAVAAADAACGTWARTTLGERQQAVARFLGLLGEGREELASIVARENGKTIREARAEIDSALAEGSYHRDQVSRFFGHTLPHGTMGVKGWVQYRALGVAAIISPWNFPVNVICRKALPALLTGNTVVMKPATFTPWTGVYLAGLFQRAGFPDGVVNCVTGSGSDIGDALVGDDRVRAISFTGSTEVGRRIQARAAARLARTQLELGGKNALIVLEDADLDAATEAAIAAGFACAGQWCTSTSRLLVQRGVYATFLEKLTARCARLRVGDPLEETTDMGPVAGPQQHQRITEAIARAERGGARRLTRGLPAEALSGGYFVPPTIFADVTPDSALFRMEIFGPVLAATPFHTLEEGLRLANDSSYALSSAIFTRDLRRAFAYLDGIEAGLAHVNLHTGLKLPALPFGGWKDSGAGLPENDSTGLEFFVNRTAVYLRTA